MASIRITIETDGAAFHDDDDDQPTKGIEVAYVLRELAKQFWSHGASQSPRDSNGNECGKVEEMD